MNSVRLAAALLLARVRTELHIYDRAGPHGLGLAEAGDLKSASDKDPAAPVGLGAQNWFETMLQWLETNKIIQTYE